MPVVRYTTINGEIVAEKRNGVRSLYVPDALGSTVALLDNTQTKTDTFASWPYGETVHLTGTNPTPFTFVGTQGYHADSSSRTYVRARVLEPPKARWLTEDPIEIDAVGLNLQAYTWDMPVTLADSSGLFPLCLVFPPRNRPEPPQPAWPMPPPRLFPVDVCPNYGPGSGVLPVHGATEQCLSCCDRVFGNLPRKLARCKQCCTQYNNSAKYRRHCTGATKWPKPVALPPGAPPNFRGCPPGQIWSTKLSKCVTPQNCNLPYVSDGQGGCVLLPPHYMQNYQDWDEHTPAPIR